MQQEPERAPFFFKIKEWVTFLQILIFPLENQRRNAAGTGKGPFFLAKGALLKNIPPEYFSIHPRKCAFQVRVFRPLRWATKGCRVPVAHNKAPTEPAGENLPLWIPCDFLKKIE